MTPEEYDRRLDPSYTKFKDDHLRCWPMNDAFREIELRRQEYAASVRVCERELENCRRLGPKRCPSCTGLSLQIP